MAAAGLTTWRNRRVLVTGHTGFVGSWLATMLVTLGAEVAGFAADADHDVAGRGKWLTELGVTGIKGDVRDPEAVRGVVREACPEVVVHLAAQPLVSVGYADPRTTLETNICGSVNVLDAVRRSSAAAVVHVTSDKCYRNRAWAWPYREIDELGGGCPYSVSKAVAEQVFGLYAELFRASPAAPGVASVRFGNIVGGGDFAANRLVPDCLAALRDSRPVRLRQPSSVRPWQHVLDVVHGLLLLADALVSGAVPSGEVFNFAPPGDGATARELAAALIAAWGDGVIDSGASLEFPEEELLRLDGRKAATALGWRHHFGLDAMADWIVRWQRAVLAGDPAGAATMGQVEEFLATQIERKEHT